MNPKKSLYLCLKREMPLVSYDEYELEWDRMMIIREKVIAYFEELRNGFIESGDTMRDVAYRRIVETLKHTPYPLLSREQALRIKGIGDKTWSKIEALYNSPEFIPDVLDNNMKVIRDFKKIWGVGDVKAKALYAKGYRTYADIPERELTAQQRIGLKYVEDLQRKIPHEYIARLEPVFREVAEAVGGVIEICGSYRRKKPLSGDIDILITDGDKNTFKMFTNELLRRGIITETLAYGNLIFEGIIQVHNFAARLDIHYTPKQEWGAALLHFTGSGQFNAALRKHAIERGYKLSEKGLFKGGVRVPAYTEEDIFSELGVQYIVPEDRERFSF